MAAKAMVAMSGGVDSSAAAVLLLEQGYEVCGATLRLFANEDIGITDRTRTCCSLDDVYDARSVAYKLGFEHYVFNFSEQFGQEVIQRFADEYACGRTPNPCVDCNRYIKFGKLLERAQLLGCNYIATGHYARVEHDENSGRWILRRAMDAHKDQTYMLYALTQHELAHTLFPLGNMVKSDVRELAQARGLINARKPDSQDICFVPDGDYVAFLENTMGLASIPGDFIDTKGRVLGRHKGVLHYTVGQRKGLGLALPQPHYVLAKNAADNTVTLGTYNELFSDSLTVSGLNWISIANLHDEMQVTVKTRYKQSEMSALIRPGKDGTVEVRFTKPQTAAAPGQAAVFYDGDIVVGGGTIV